MSTLENIAVVIAHDRPDSESTNVLPILYEIEANLRALADAGQCSGIDLSCTPLTPQQRTRLKHILGQGEVSATLNALGPTHIEETAVAGVWWITHRNEHNAVLCETVEVTICPEMLMTHPDDLHDGLDALNARLSTYTAPA